MGEPPIERWSREVAVGEAERIAERLPFASFARDVLPRLSRLTRDQRRLLAATLESALVRRGGGPRDLLERDP